jgi:acetate kinase
MALNLEANADPVLDADITGTRSRVKTFVIAAREDLQIARDVRRVLSY